MISTDDIEKNVVDYVPDELVGADSAVDGDDDGGELYEHFRFVADKGQELLRVDKFLVARLQNLPATACSRLQRRVAFLSMARL